MGYLDKTASKKKKKSATVSTDVSVKGSESLYSGGNLNASAVKVPNKSMFGRRSGSR